MTKKIHVGCSGWYYDDWIDRFYPSDVKKTEWLEYYAKHFSTVEVNSTFYHFQKEKTVQGWYERTPDDFRFTLKANRLITHKKRFEDTEGEIKRFYEMADVLEDKLATLLFQLPPSEEKDMDFLEKVINQLNPEKNNVLEFRDTSWFTDEVLKRLQDVSIGFCCVSAEGYPETCVSTADFAYVRFHGKEEWYKYLYSEDELRVWAEKISQLSAETIYCYFNNDFQGHAIQNAKTLAGLISE